MPDLVRIAQAMADVTCASIVALRTHLLLVSVPCGGKVRPRPYVIGGGSALSESPRMPTAVLSQLAASFGSEPYDIAYGKTEPGPGNPLVVSGRGAVGSIR